MRAELIRTGLDFLNHVLLYVTNKMSFGQYYNAKKFIIFIPSILFTVFGFHTLTEAYHSVISSAPLEETATSIIPLLVR